MTQVIPVQDTTSHRPVFILPYIIHRAIFNGLSPLEQIAARALEQCGKVRIVDGSDRDLGR